ncbi:reverse transcriptase [Senna tora]|uniref:Reverse transcriptase n=1 Tax=Senna tora TaxID=362788 RepID=A0A834WPP6_9FABA|nr:reverse transcriptase [Senna tora]
MREYRYRGPLPDLQELGHIARAQLVQYFYQWKVWSNLMVAVMTQAPWLQQWASLMLQSQCEVVYNETTRSTMQRLRMHGLAIVFPPAAIQIHSQNQVTESPILLQHHTFLANLHDAEIHYSITGNLPGGAVLTGSNRLKAADVCVTSSLQLGEGTLEHKGTVTSYLQRNPMNEDLFSFDSNGSVGQNFSSTSLMDPINVLAWNVRGLLVMIFEESFGTLLEDTTPVLFCCRRLELQVNPLFWGLPSKVSLSLWRIREFRNCVESCGLVDLGFVGQKYTWRNKRGNGRIVFERLDRFLANASWVNLFPNARNTHLPGIKSDHIPILLNTNPVDNYHYNHPFRCERVWLSQPDFINLAENSWKNANSINNGLCSIKEQPLIWNKLTFGNIFKRKKRVLRRLEGIGRALSEGPNHFLANLEHELSCEYQTILSQEEELWASKSRMEWLQLGNSNTSFFHASVVGRRRSNRITGLMDHVGNWILDPEQIKQSVSMYFGQCFGASPVEDFPDDIIPPQINASQVDILATISSNEEILAALRSLKPFKAPGKDGFQPSFFQKCWHFLGAFFPGRRSIDKVVVAQEITHNMKRKRKGEQSWMIIKLDLEKAYDKINWSFIENTLERMNFPHQTVKLIQSCISTVKHFILVNGGMTEEINPSRGICQEIVLQLDKCEDSTKAIPTWTGTMSSNHGSNKLLPTTPKHIWAYPQFRRFKFYVTGRTRVMIRSYHFGIRGVLSQGMVNTRMEGRVESAEREMGAMRGELNTVKGDVDAMKEWLLEIKDSIGRLERKVDGKDEQLVPSEGSGSHGNGDKEKEGEKDLEKEHQDGGIGEK